MVKVLLLVRTISGIITTSVLMVLELPPEMLI